MRRDDLKPSLRFQKQDELVVKATFRNAELGQRATEFHAIETVLWYGLLKLGSHTLYQTTAFVLRIFSHDSSGRSLVRT